MANKPKKAFYAVRVGRQGKQIYTTWPEAAADVNGYPTAQHRGFMTRQEAEAWVNEPIPQALHFDLTSPAREPAPTSSGSKRKSDVISLLSSDEAGPADDLPFTSLKRPRSSLLSRDTPLQPNAAPNSGASTSSQTAIVLDDSDDESNLSRPVATVFKSASPELPLFPGRKLPSPLPRHAPLMPFTGPLPTLPVDPTAPVASTSLLPVKVEEDVKPEIKIELSAEQEKLLSLAKQGHSLFFTGSAGTGKSHQHWRQTLHSFAGMGLAKEKPEILLFKLQSPKGKRGRERWQSARALIIDEISMVDCVFFDKLDYVARALRGKPMVPFGGLQVIATGDFFQLPPVSQFGGGTNYCFKALCFHKLFQEMHVLRQVFRQKEARFAGILNKLREGIVDDDCLRMFRQLNRPLQYRDGIEPTHLMATKVEVASINETQLAKLEGANTIFEARDSNPPSKRGFRLPLQEATEKLNRNTLAEAKLPLKKGAQVMLIKNMPDFALVNGSRGKVLGFYTENELVNLQREGVSVAVAHDPAEDPRVREKRMREIKMHREMEEYERHDQEMLAAQYEEVAQLAAAAGLAGADDAGQLAPMFQTGDMGAPPPIQRPIIVDDGPCAVRFPVVQFTSIALLIPPVAFEMQNGDGDVEAVRYAVPLILSWSLTVHKSQGQTIDRLKVDLGSVFEHGQSYVALSRATSMQGLEVRNFKPSCIKAHPEAKAFYDQHTK